MSFYEIVKTLYHVIFLNSEGNQVLFVSENEDELIIHRELYPGVTVQNLKDFSEIFDSKYLILEDRTQSKNNLIVVSREHWNNISSSQKFEILLRECCPMFFNGMNISEITDINEQQKALDNFSEWVICSSMRCAAMSELVITIVK